MKLGVHAAHYNYRKCLGLKMVACASPNLREACVTITEAYPTQRTGEMRYNRLTETWKEVIYIFLMCCYEFKRTCHT